MVESCDELIMEFTNKYGYNHSDEDADNEDEDDDDGGDTTTPPAPMPLAAAPEVIVVEEEDLMKMIPEQDAPRAHEVILADAEPELSQPHLYNVIMRDYKESPSRMMDDRHELDDLIEADYDVDEWFPEYGSNDRD
jgi:hypothetical protein